MGRLYLFADACFSKYCRLLVLVSLLAYASLANACIPTINWNDSINFCGGNSITLSAVNQNSTYLWSTGATTSTLTVTSSGTYWVKVTNPCGSANDTVHVSADSPLYLNLGVDRKVCQSTTLNVPQNSFSTYLWQDGSTASQMQVTQTGTYWVEVVNGCGTFEDTVHIIVEPQPNPNLGPDINDCTPTTHSFYVPTFTKASVLWSTGDTGTSISTANPGTYWVQMSNSCGTFSDSVTVTLNQGQTLSIGDTINKCANGLAVLQANVTGGSYQWSTGASSKIISVQSPGSYWLQYTDPCGTYYDTVVVVNSGKAQVNLGPDTTVCASDLYTLRTGVRGAVHLWHNGTTGSSFTVTKAGTYWVGVDNGCGYSYDTIHVSVITKPKLNLSDTIYYCENQSTIMDANSYAGVTGFAWDNGQTSNTRSFSSPGAHWLKVWNSCDTVTENFYVQSFKNQSFSLGPDTILCEKDWELDPQLTAYGNNYMWGNGSTAPSITVNSTGTYWVEIQNACDTLSDTINLIFLNDLKPISRAAVRICAGDTAEVGPPPQTQVSYQWSTGDTSRTTFHSQGGWYHLMAYNQCDTLWDSVRVIVDQPINVNLGPDTTFCQPGVHFINVTRYNADSIYWSTGSRNAGLPINKSGTYWVDLYNACGMFSDTINVSVDLLPKRKLSNRAFCIGTIDTLDVSQSIVQSYQWNTGATTSSIQVSQTGWYKVDMTNNCGTVRDSAYVRVDNPIPQFSLGADTIFCQGSLLLNPALKGFVNYQWQDGSANPTFTVYQSGQYYLTASNTCNTRSDTIDVLITGPPVLVLGDEVRLCNGTLLTLNAQNPGSSYLWSTGDTTQQFTTDSSGTYWVTITNDCGQLTDTVDVFVDFPLLDLNLGADTIICRGQALTLQTQYPSAKTLWNTGATSTSITVNKTGQYWVEVSNTCGKWLDSIYVTVEDIPVFSLGNDSTICAFDGSFPINGPPGMLHYQWSNGDSTQGTVLTDAGAHWLKVSNHCFSYTDTIFLKEEYPIPLELGPDTIICFGESLVLDPGNLGYPITWKGGRRQQSIEVTRSGTYWASARNSCGVFDDTITVRVDHYLDDSPIDTLICRGDSAVLDISNRHYDVQWADGSTDSVRWFADAGTYPLTLFNRCGAFPKDFIVEQQLCDCPLFIPNAFTPNDDQLNDSFEIVHKCAISRFELQIFNRWGEMVFSSDSPELSWDGKFNGRPAPIGAYHFSLVYAWKVYGVERTRERSGRINLIR